MRREPVAVGEAAWCIQQVEEPRDQMAARDGRTMCGDLTSRDAVRMSSAACNTAWTWRGQAARRCASAISRHRRIKWARQV